MGVPGVGFAVFPDRYVVNGPGSEPSSVRVANGGLGGWASTFSAFFAAAEPRLRRAFVAAYGGDRGCEATAEALVPTTTVP